MIVAIPLSARLRQAIAAGLTAALALGLGSVAEAQKTPAPAKAAPAVEKPYQVEWVYRVAYGHQAEWWKIFQKYQIAILDREKQLGYVADYAVFRPGLHTSEDSRWDYRIVITYPNQAGATHEAEIEKQLFPDHAALEAEDQRRWELTLNHWDLPIHQIDPHEPPG